MGKRYDDTFLTKEQYEVLRLRAMGYSLSEIAARLGTSRSNVSVLLKRAMRNVERARRTLRAYIELFSEVSVRVEAGTRVEAVPFLVYRTADMYGVKVRYSSAEIVRKIYDELPHAVEGDRLTKDLTVLILRDGKIEVRQVA